MVVVNRRSVMTDALRGRSKPNQPEPSRLYAQAQEGAEKKEWDVTNPYKLEKPAKKGAKTPKTKGCGPNPKKSAAEIISYDDAQLKAYQATLKRFQECVIKECEVKCGPKPTMKRSEFSNDAKRKKLRKEHMKHKECVEQCKQQKETTKPKPAENKEWGIKNPYE